MIELVGYACALALAVVFVWAGVAKLRQVEETRAAFAALGIPKSAAAARIVPVMELAIAAVLVAAPSVGGAIAFGSLLAFNLILVRAVRSGSPAPCNCFGSHSAEPVSRRDLLRNVGLMVLAMAAAVLT
ncbi:MAG: MauE/DoxX family redox-associated membrane protein [Acidimicrobiales bacterium]